MDTDTLSITRDYRFDAPWKAHFFTAFETTGNITGSAALAGVTRQAVHYARKHDPAFAAFSAFNPG